MKNGIWREYKRNDEQSYELLYNDLKDSGKDWYLTENSGNCYTEIHGRIDGGTSGGDVYVYYTYNGKKYVPEFYIKVCEPYCLIGEEEERNYIEFNSSNIYGYKIKCEYFPELIKKLKEIDEKKNKKTIDKVKKIYENHRKLLSLQKQESYTEKQLVFLYKMSASPLELENTNLAKTILNGRNVQNDFDQMKLKNKVNLFLAIKETDLVNELFIDSKEVILALAQNSTLKQLQNTTEEIINDKEYIMYVLENFFKSDEVSIRIDEFDNYLPVQYQTDIDIIKLTYYKYTSLINCSFLAWYGKNPELREKFKNPEFCYQVIDAFARSRIEKGKKYYESDLLPVFPEKVRNHIEEHILIGPEPSEKRQQLKEDSIKILKKERDYVNSRLKK